MTKNKELYKNAVAAIDALFSDDSVSIDEAIENLEELQAEIEGKIECLKEDLQRGE